MAKLQVTPGAAFTECNELNFQGLYMYHTPLGPKANQAAILESKAKIGIGATVVNNWAVYDGPGPGAKLVGRAQGLHILAGNWVNSFTLVFEDERYVRMWISIGLLLAILFDWPTSSYLV
jgi:hypothetical protein